MKSLQDADSQLATVLPTVTKLLSMSVGAIESTSAAHTKTVLTILAYHGSGGRNTRAGIGLNAVVIILKDIHRMCKRINGVLATPHKNDAIFAVFLTMVDVACTSP